MAANARMMRCCRRLNLIFSLMAIAFALSCSLVFALEAGMTGDAGGAVDSSSTASEGDEVLPPVKKKEVPPSANEDDWGSFYDPNKVFCGKFDCYKILGFDHMEWGSSPPSLKDITKSYRGLSRVWHPDKNKAKGAREKFVAIAKAYEILTNKEKRAEYDHFRDRPDEYFIKYGSSVTWAFAPKSDASIIMVFFLIGASLFTYYAQKNKWQTIANHLVKAATEDLSPREGASTESIEIREKALVILTEKKDKAAEANQTNGASEKKKKGPKLTGREKKEKAWEELRPICVELVNEIDDFGAGFRKPTMQDLLVIKMLKWPYYLAIWLFWWSKYAVNRLRKLDLTDVEREVLTKNAVGEVSWVAVSDEERVNMLTLELWITDNLIEWREEQEMKLAGLSANKMKQIKKMRKNGKASSVDDDFHID